MVQEAEEIRVFYSLQNRQRMAVNTENMCIRCVRRRQKVTVNDRCGGNLR